MSAKRDLGFLRVRHRALLLLPLFASACCKQQAGPVGPNATCPEKSAEGGSPGPETGAEPPEAAPEPQHSEDQIYFFDQQELAVGKIVADGLILDIGGGGEGIIGRLNGEQVVAIDLSKRELEGAPAGPLKLVMDATKLAFLDKSFATATCFFTLMYIPPKMHADVFHEVARVLEPGGRFLVWDVVFPETLDAAKPIAAFRFRFVLPSAVVETGYGSPWPAKPLDLAHYEGLARAAGLEVLAGKVEGRIILLELRKSAAR